jgi:hypothetical protein
VGSAVHIVRKKYRVDLVRKPTLKFDSSKKPR